MNRSQTQDLIQQIEAFSGTSWPSNAADAWLVLLVKVDAADAWQAVTEWFNQPEPPGRIHPGYVVRRANSIRDLRERVARRAIEPAPTGARPPAEVARVRAELIKRYGEKPPITRRARQAA